MSEPRTAAERALAALLLWLPLAAAALAVAPGCKDREDNTPIVNTATPGAQGGVVAISYVIRDRETRPVTVTAAFTRDLNNAFLTPATAAPGSESLTGLAASPGGTSHTFLWDSVKDIGPGRHPTVIFRIEPVGDGEAGSTAPFPVENLDLAAATAGAARADRRGHALAELPDGRALLVGGRDAAGTLVAPAETFDPATGTFTTVDPLAAPRAGHTATFYFRGDGRAFVLVVGGRTDAGALASVERFDPAAGTFTTLAATLGTAREGHTATLLADGRRILVAGGRDDAGGALDDAQVFDVDAETFAPAFTIAGARADHSATRLRDGRVLLAGGRTAGAGALATSALSTDATATAFAPGPALVAARTGHADALLGDGRVLLAGGADATGAPLASSELFVPAGQASPDVFVATGSLSVPRAQAAVAPLPDGQAVVAGGTDGRLSLASIDRFDPRANAGAGAFAVPRGGLSAPRAGARALALANGRVLVAGGGAAAADVFFAPSLAVLNPQAFVEVVALPAARAEHRATALLDGRVLATGGTDGLLAAGGPRPLATAEVITVTAFPGSEVAPTVSTLGAARRRHTATLLLDGRVLVAGGLDAAGAPLRAAELFDPVAGTFSSTGDLLLARAGHAAVLLVDGRVLLVGGVSSPASAEVFDPATGGFADAGDVLDSPRAEGHTATRLADGRVLVAGGRATPGGTPLATAELFVPATATGDPARFDPLSPLTQPHAEHVAVVLVDGRVLVAGGRALAAGDGTSATDLFDPVAAAFTAGPPLAAARADAVGAALSNGRALVAGGTTAPLGAIGLAPALASVELFDPTSNAFVPAADPTLAAARRGAAAAATTTGRVAIVGGRSSSGASIPGAERLEP